jgi:hypothetical protein
MAGDPWTPEAVEREIEERRAEMRDTFEALRGRVAPEELAGRAGDMLRQEGAMLADVAMRRARRNPLAAAMVVAGIAWLVLGPDRVPPKRRRSAQPVRRDAPPPAAGPARRARAVPDHDPVTRSRGSRKSGSAAPGENRPAPEQAQPVTESAPPAPAVHRPRNGAGY